MFILLKKVWLFKIFCYHAHTHTRTHVHTLVSDNKKTPKKHTLPHQKTKKRPKNDHKKTHDFKKNAKNVNSTLVKLIQKFLTICCIMLKCFLYLHHNNKTKKQWHTTDKQQ